MKQTLRENNGRLLFFRSKILDLDERSEVINVKMVCHFKCGKMLQMKYAYNTRNFATHIVNCSGPPKSVKLPAGGMQTIGTFFQRKSSSSQSSSTLQTALPCPGLSSDCNAKIKVYLDHTGAHGGGASSVTVISHEFYGKKYRHLSRSRKIQVKVAQKHDWVWRNDAEGGRVFSTACGGKASGPASSPEPCTACVTLLKKQTIQKCTSETYTT